MAFVFLRGALFGGVWDDPKKRKRRGRQLHSGSGVLKKLSSIGPAVEDCVAVLERCNGFWGRLKGAILKLIVQGKATMDFEDHNWRLCRIIGLELEPNLNTQDSILDVICH
jgi:hypothetical protein